MHWEKEIRIRITIRRLVIAVLAASTAANLVIVGVVFGEDSPITTPTVYPLLTVTPLPTAAVIIPTSLPGEPAIPTATQIPGVVPSDTFTPVPTSTDSPLWIVCIKRFYWPTYRVQPGDTLFSLASATGSTVREVVAANCLTNDRINAGQLLHLPRLPMDVALTPTSTATQTPTATVTSSQTSTNTATASATMTNSPTATVTPSQTMTNTSTVTPSSTNTETPSATMTNSPTATSTNSSIYTATPTPTNTPRIIVTVGTTGGPTLVSAP